MSSTDFEWQTDEEEKGVVVRPTAEPAVRRQWPWRLVMGVLLLGAAVYGGLRWRTARQTEAITTDVKIAHALVQEAQAAQDVEMLNLVLSGRDLGWQEAQQQLMAEGNFASRPAFGLQVTPVTNVEPVVEVAPDLKEVVVISPQTFDVDGGGEVVMQQTAVYRQGSRNWLLSPPEETFWGQTLITYTRYFTVTYPQRDEVLVQRLTADLNLLFSEKVCDRILQCGRVHIDLRFSTSPQSLVNVTEPQGLLTMGEPLLLPTATLVGLPVDEAGYEVLYKGYGAQVVTAVIAHLFDYTCCDHALLTHALLAKQASELGLQEWPLAQTDYSQLLNFTFESDLAEAILAAEDLSETADRQPAYALVDFLMMETGWNPVQLQAAVLRGNTAISLPQLVREPGFMERWLTFVYEQRENGSPAVPLPSTIQAACFGSPGMVLYSYNLTTGNWSIKVPARLPFVGRTQLWPLPGSEGYLVNQEMYTRFETETRLTLHYEEQDFLLRQYILTELYPIPKYTFEGVTDPHGRFLVFHESGRTRFDGSYFIIDLHSCAHERCQMQVVFGKPHWSPDGSQIVMQERPIRNRDNNPYEPFQLPLALGAGAGESVISIGTGYAPQWLDNHHYTYLRLNDALIPEFVVEAVESADGPQVQLEAVDLVTAVPAAQRPEQLFMRDALITSPRQIAIIAATELLTDSLEYVFLWDAVNDPRLAYVGEALQVDFSPDGRWLTLTEPNNTVTLIHTSTGEQRQFHSPNMPPDWTADSQWLLTGRANYLLLTAIQDNYQQIVLNNDLVCSQISWGR